MGHDSLFYRKGDYYDIPLLVHQCMTRNTIALTDVLYLQEDIAHLPVMERIEFKMLKANSKNMPPDWRFDKGDVCVTIPNGPFVGRIHGDQFERAGLRTGKAYGFVEPPSYDYKGGSCITPYYRVFVYCDYNAIFNDAHGVVFFKR